MDEESRPGGVSSMLYEKKKKERKMDEDGETINDDKRKENE